MKIKTLLACLLFIPGHTLYAQTENLSWKLAGRLHFDGVGYVNSPDTLSPQLDIVDARLGGKVTMGNWYLTIDFSFAGSKVTAKDIFVQYAKDGNYYRVGHQFGSFGFEQTNSSNDLLFNAAANVTNLFSPGRRLGFTYTRTKPSYYISAGAFLGDDINVKTSVKQGHNMTLRGAWKPINEETSLLHIGASGYYRVPDMDKASDSRELVISAKGVTRTKSVALQYLALDNVQNQIQVGSDCYFFKDKWMMQAEYMWMRVNRKHAEAYQGHGGYIQAGYLIRGSHFGYDEVDALPTMPTDNGSLLLIARYNNSRMNDFSSQLYAGNQQDFSLGLDYFYNKHLSTRLSYSYVKLDKHASMGEQDIHTILGRIQFKF